MKNYSQLYRNLCLNLLTIRKVKNLDQVDFAKKCGLSRYQYSRIEGANVNPPLESIFKICDAFDVQIGDLFKDPFSDSLRIEKREPIFIRQNKEAGVQEEKYISSINKNLIVRKFTLQAKQVRRLRLQAKIQFEIFVVSGEVLVNAGKPFKTLQQGEHLSVNFDPQLSFEKDDRENIKIASLHGAEILLIQTVLQ